MSDSSSQVPPSSAFTQSAFSRWTPNTPLTAPSHLTKSLQQNRNRDQRFQVTRNYPCAQESSNQFLQFVRLMQLFPDVHPATLHTALYLCQNDFLCAVDKLLYAKQVKQAQNGRANVQQMCCCTKIEKNPVKRSASEPKSFKVKHIDVGTAQENAANLKLQHSDNNMPTPEISQVNVALLDNIESGQSI